MLRILFVSALVILTANTANACECETPSQPQAFRKAAAVFVGQVVDIRESDVSYGEGASGSVAVKFKVGQYWKGSASSEITIHTEQGALSCRPFEFEEGKEYLVYARGKQLIVWIGCSRSLPLSGSPVINEELKMLGKGKKPKVIMATVE